MAGTIRTYGVTVAVYDLLVGICTVYCDVARYDADQGTSKRTATSIAPSLDRAA